MELYLVRHGQTEYNASNLFFGITDAPLTPKGEEQAQHMAEKLKDITFDHCYCSPLIRAKDTAQAILNKNDHPFEVELLQELREVDFGEWETLSFSQIMEKFPENLNSYVTNFFDHTFTGGQSIADFLGKVKDFLTMLQNKEPYGRILIVSHIGVIGAILNLLLFKDIKDLFVFNIPTGGLSVVNMSDNYPRLTYLGT